MKQHPKVNKVWKKSFHKNVEFLCMQKHNFFCFFAMCVSSEDYWFIKKSHFLTTRDKFKLKSWGCQHGWMNDCDTNDFQNCHCVVCLSIVRTYIFWDKFSLFFPSPFLSGYCTSNYAYNLQMKSFTHWKMFQKW